MQEKKNIGQKNIFFFGCGKMGNIIANKILQENIFSAQNLLILKPSANNQISNVKYIHNLEEIPNNYQADIVFIAIKPQNSQKILEDFTKAKIFHENTIIISILAGKKIDFFTKIFGVKTKIVRIMPNLAIEVNQGIVPIFYYNLNDDDKKLINDIFNNFGVSFAIDNEELFHILTALYGCGPAYIFLLQEIFENIALKYKIPPQIALDLTHKLFTGSSLLSSQNNIGFAELRKKVTSKKGVTEASLKNLVKNNKLQKLFMKAIENGIKKSQRLQ